MWRNNDVRGAHGGLIGVTGAGAIFSGRVQSISSTSMANAKFAVARGPAVFGSMSASRPATIEVYRHAIATVFVAGVGVLALALIGILFLPELPLLPRKSVEKPGA